MVRNYPMKQSTLIMVVLVAILVTIAIPKLFSGNGNIREEEFITSDGKVLNCVIYSEANGAGGMDCFLDGNPLPSAPTD